MAQYLTYDEYISYGGDLPSASFAVAELQARKKIDKLTSGNKGPRVANMAVVPDEVKILMVKLIDLDAAYGIDAQIANAPKSGAVASFNTDGYSESYVQVSSADAANTAAELQKQMDAQIKTLLNGVNDDNGTPLLYRGLDR